VSHRPDYAPAFLVFSTIGVTLVAVGLIVMIDLGGLGQRWMESLYVHGPSKADGTDRPFDRAAVRYRIYAGLVVVFGVWATYSGVSAIFQT
jgi:hypothetical protein